MNFVVYYIINIVNNKQYIGCSSNFDKRKKEHLYKLHKQKHENIYLQRAWDKYGENNFTFEVKFQFSTSKEMYNKEIELIYQENNLYNTAKGGQGGDIFSTLSEEKQLEIRKIKSKQTKEFFKTGVIPKPKKFKEYLEGEALNKQLLKWSECKKGKKNSRFKYSDKVYQLDLTYKIVKIWDFLYNLKNNEEYTYQYVRKCCLKIKGYNKHKNFYWMFEKDYKLFCEG
jgi:group I intron endonuclease